MLTRFLLFCISLSLCLLLATAGTASQKILASNSAQNLDDGRVIASDQSADSKLAQLNQQFPQTVILPIYQSLAEQTERLAEAGQAFEQSPNEASLSTFRADWLAAATAWARSQAVAFGPVHSLGHEAALNFPPDEAGIDGLLLEEEDIEAAVDLESTALLPSLQGFEAMAYLLYGDEGEKAAADFSRRERQYLRRLATTAQAVAFELVSAWQTGWENYPAYEALLATAGQPGNGAYMTVQSGTEEIVRSTINALAIVADETIPHILEAPEQLSDPSGSTILQLLDSTVQGIQTAYVGTESEDRLAGGIGMWVAAEDEEIDLQIRQSLNAAIERIEDVMATPGDTESLSAAQAFLEIAKDRLEQDMLPLVQLQTATS